MSKNITTERLADLRHVAECATPGPWWIDSHGHNMVSFANNAITPIFSAKDLIVPAVRHPDTGNLSHWPNDWDATYISMVDPTIVLGLLDKIEELEEKLATTQCVSTKN